MKLEFYDVMEEFDAVQKFMAVTREAKDERRQECIEELSARIDELGKALKEISNAS